jgi:hypothetical protein
MASQEEENWILEELENHEIQIAAGKVFTKLLELIYGQIQVLVFGLVLKYRLRKFHIPVLVLKYRSKVLKIQVLSGALIFLWVGVKSNRKIIFWVGKSNQVTS